MAEIYKLKTENNETFFPELSTEQVVSALFDKWNVNTLQDDTKVVHKEGDETLNGTKTFTLKSIFNNGLKVGAPIYYDDLEVLKLEDNTLTFNSGNNSIVIGNTLSGGNAIEVNIKGVLKVNSEAVALKPYVDSTFIKKQNTSASAQSISGGLTLQSGDLTVSTGTLYASAIKGQGGTENCIYLSRGEGIYFTNFANTTETYYKLPNNGSQTESSPSILATEDFVTNTCYSKIASDGKYLKVNETNTQTIAGPLTISSSVTINNELLVRSFIATPSISGTSGSSIDFSIASGIKFKPQFAPTTRYFNFPNEGSTDANNPDLIATREWTKATPKYTITSSGNVLTITENY